MRSFIRSGKLWLISTAAGGSLLVLEGCDPTVRDTVITGVAGATNTLVTSVIQAFFESIAAQGQDTTPTTVKAMELMTPHIFA
ncbi:MAG: hypothetical protein U1D55_00055 [Phycisphaerae bacterium]